MSHRNKMDSISITTEQILQPLVPNSKKVQPYSTRNRSLQHNSLRPESITAALQGGISSHKRSRDQLTVLDEHMHNRRTNFDDIMQQKPTKKAYQQ